MPRQKNPPPPVPDFSRLSGADMWAAGWPRIKRSGTYDPYRQMRPHPNALAHRRLCEESAGDDRNQWMHHPVTRALYRMYPEGFTAFPRAIDYGLNPYDIDWAEYYALEWAAEARQKAEANAKSQHREEARLEERRRNPPPPLKAYRLVSAVNIKQPGALAAQRVPQLALHKLFGRSWKPFNDNDRGVPVFELYWLDPDTGQPLPTHE